MKCSRIAVNLDLSFVQLVVLSACDSSIGKIERGVSMQGLAYAFIYSGVKNVLATKNKVDDTLTSIFIPKFYQFLTNNSVSESLRLTREYFHQTNYDVFKVYTRGKDKIEVTGELKTNHCKNFLANWSLWS